MKKGHWLAIGTYGLWGLYPVYWKWLQHVPSPQLLTHRIFWSFLCLLTVLLLLRQCKVFGKAILRRAIWPAYVAAAGLISINWLTYIWAVNAGFIVETSLGYFINPLLSVLLGVIFLRERLRPFQWFPLGLAAVGILYMTFSYGSLPWIALTLASTWALYGLVKKTAPLGPLHGLTLETGILLLPVLTYLVYKDRIGQGVFLHAGVASDLLLVSTGLVTTIPLWMFASAVQSIPLSVIGILQYIAPTIQFLIGVLVYHEPFTGAQCTGFGLVWTALILFGVESFLSHRAPPDPVAPE